MRDEVVDSTFIIRRGMRARAKHRQACLGYLPKRKVCMAGVRPRSAAGVQASTSGARASLGLSVGLSDH